MSHVTDDAGAGRQVPISRRRALALLAAVPTLLAIGAALPTNPVQAAEPEPEPWPPAIWPFTLIWHDPLTQRERCALREFVAETEARFVRRGDPYRISADEWGHVTLTWTPDEGQDLLEILGVVYRRELFHRKVPFSVSWPPLPAPRTEAEWAIAREWHQRAMATA